MEQTVMFLALKKALDVESQLLTGQGGIRACDQNTAVPQVRIDSKTVIIAADTIVYKNGIIGKPIDEIDALNTLKLLRNTRHYVATGVALLRPGGPKRSVFCDVTEVFFKDYSDEEIINYLNTPEPWDKAGSYAIQGAWGKHVSHIIGNYDNVIGFPWERIQAELKANWPEIDLA